MKTNRIKAYFINTLFLAIFCCLYCLTGGLTATCISLFISAFLAITFYHDHVALAVINALLVLLIFAVFHDAVSALVVGVPVILLALTLVLGTRLKLTFTKLLSLCSFLFLAVLLFGMYVLQQAAGESMSLSSVFLDVGRQVSESFLTEYGDAAMSALIQETVSMAVDLMIMLAPAMFLCISTALAGILIWLYKNFQRKNKVDLSFIGSFTTLQAGRLFTVIYLVLVFLMFSAPQGMFFSLSVNVVLFLSFLYVALGIFVYIYKFKKQGMKKNFRIILFVMIFSISTTFMMLPLLFFLVTGVLDSFLDYRKLRISESNKM